MKQYKFILLSFVIFLHSCDLDRTPNSDGTFWTSKEEVQIGLNAAYQPLYEEEGYGRGQYWTDLSDDMIFNRQRSSEDPLALFTATNNNSGNVKDNFRLMYRTIRRANDVMAYAPVIEMSESERNRMLGEANFLCAFSYFFLAKRYGGVAFYDWREPTKLNKPRETKNETYKRIVDYLEESIRFFEEENLWKREGANSSSWGRPQLGAAYGLLAKVYAHWGNYREAKIAASKVIDTELYSLNTTDNNGYEHLFTIAGEKHDEVLFNLTCTFTNEESTITSIVGLSAKMSGGAGWWYFAPTKSLVESYETGDTRRKVTLKGAGDEVYWKPYYEFRKKTEEEKKEKGESYVEITLPTPILASDISDMATGYMFTKFCSPYDNLNTWTWYTGKDVPLLRYADILLIRAEAEIFLAGGGPNNRTQGVPAAAEFLNEVRVRAFGGDQSKAIAAPSFNDLMKERRCELAYEDERHFDLVRWGLAKEIYTNPNTTDPRGARPFDPAKHNHLLFPQAEVDDSNGVLLNNPLPGYSDFSIE